MDFDFMQVLIIGRDTNNRRRTHLVEEGRPEEGLSSPLLAG